MLISIFVCFVFFQKKISKRQSYKRVRTITRDFKHFILRMKRSRPRMVMGFAQRDKSN